MHSHILSRSTTNWSFDTWKPHVVMLQGSEMLSQNVHLLCMAAPRAATLHENKMRHYKYMWKRPPIPNHLALS